MATSQSPLSNYQMLHEVSFVFRRNTFKHIKAIDRVIQFWQRFLNHVVGIER